VHTDTSLDLALHCDYIGHRHRCLQRKTYPASIPRDVASLLTTMTSQELTHLLRPDILIGRGHAADVASSTRNAGHATATVHHNAISRWLQLMRVGDSVVGKLTA